MMKKVLLLVFILAACFCVSQQSHTTRFEETNWENPNNGSFINTITAWHDKESGIEFICVAGQQIRDGWNQPVQTSPISCFPTGRKWGK